MSMRAVTWKVVMIWNENKLDAENNEEVNLEPTLRFQSEGGFEINLDLKQ